MLKDHRITSFHFQTGNWFKIKLTGFQTTATGLYDIL